MAISFPAIDPVAIALGPLQIRWYALAYMAGFILGWRYVLYLCGLSEKDGARGAPTRLHIDDFLPWAILGVILGGRFGYVLFYQAAYYASDPLEILKVWQGGMSFHGGALGVIFAMIGFAKFQKISFLRLSDYVCCAVPVGLFFGRLANFVNGELFGRVTVAPWGVVFPAGGLDPRHPSQIYEALLEGLLLTAILAYMIHLPSVRNRPGIVAGAFLAFYALFRMIVEFFREPDRHIGFIAGIFTMGQILCLPMMAAGFFVIFLSLRRGMATP